MRTLRNLIWLLLFVLPATGVFSQSNEKINRIPLEESDDDYEINDDIESERNLELLSILPTMYYYSTTEEIGIVSNFVTFEDVAYEIRNEQGATILSDTISLPKNEEVFVSTASLPSGKYYIYIIIHGFIIKNSSGSEYVCDVYPRGSIDGTKLDLNTAKEYLEKIIIAK